MPQIVIGELATPGKGSSQRNMLVRLVRRFHFSSELKRMSAIVALDHETPPPLLAVAKVRTIVTQKVAHSHLLHSWIVMQGAPEMMRQFFKEIPENYDHVHQLYARRGLRVIAAGYKPLGVYSMHDSSKLTRQDIESDLTFGGFLVFSSVLKPESLVVVKHLLESAYKVRRRLAHCRLC